MNKKVDDPFNNRYYPKLSQNEGQHDTSAVYLFDWNHGIERFLSMLQRD